ncbi:MAG: sulfatase-like hydrolase/transferase [Planctomycetota bacterium]|nr:sulfatase-like hydrolase/transferase [Planctomycetota bacterium]
MASKWTILSILMYVAPFAAARELPREKPNIVWILSEDNSKHYLKLYDEGGMETPGIEALGAHGLVFDRAFSCSPVCSVARTTLMTSCYAPRIGTQFHRKLQVVPLPAGVRMFPAILREAGYYTTNRHKTDYNADAGETVWDESSKGATWRNRASSETPFFHMQSHADSHEGSLHLSKKKLEADTPSTPLRDVLVAECHPDTSLFRATHARYLDRMTRIDGHVAQLVADLAEDGLLEDTFIFYFGDHGGVLPRSKGYVYETGLHVPLVVRVPDNWKHLVDGEWGTRPSGFVSFVDFGPTALHLAGIDVPDTVDGQPFLGAGFSDTDLNLRQEVLGHADRFDEKYDLVRSLRRGHYKYIRNFEAHYPDGLQNNYRYRMPAYTQWRDMYRAGELNPAQALFFEPKAPEALYDLRTDPYEVHNLALEAAHSDTLEQMRAGLMGYQKKMPDLSLFPESQLIEAAFGNPVAFGQENKPRIANLIDTANLCLLPFEKATHSLQSAIKNDDPWQRYWSITACIQFGHQAASIAPLIEAALHDAHPLVRMRAAEYFCLTSDFDPAPLFKQLLSTSTSHVETLILLNSIVFLRDGGPGVSFQLPRSEVRAQDKEINRRLDYLGW